MKESNIKNLIEKVDIVDVISSFSKLYKTGGSYKTLCNVHGDQSPSLSINTSKQIYKCFVCDHGGDALDYLIWSQKMTFVQAVEFLANLSGEEASKFITIKKPVSNFNERQTKIVKALTDANTLFKYFLDIKKDEDLVKSFLKKRNLDSNDIAKYSIGYAPKVEETNYLDHLLKKNNSMVELINSSLSNENSNRPFFNNRLLFPIFDEWNNIVAFSGRVLQDSDSPKYLHSKESAVFKKSELIYNYNNAKNYETIIIVEGFMDVIAFNKIGQDNAVALMGTSLSSNIIFKLKKHKEILIFLDSDSAGQKATMKIIDIFIKNKISSYVLINDFNKDASDILNSENGKEKLIQVLNSKKTVIDFAIEFLFKQIDKEDAEQTKKVIQKIGQYLQFFDDFVKQKIVTKLASEANVSPDLIIKVLNQNLNVIKFNNDYKEIGNGNKKPHLNKTKDLNISDSNKILIALWQNPSLAQCHLLDNLVLTSAKENALLKEIINSLKSNQNISLETKNHLEKMYEAISNKLIIPKNNNEFIEVIDRLPKEKEKSKKDYIKDKISTSDSKEEKIFLLNTKRKLINKDKK